MNTDTKTDGGGEDRRKIRDDGSRWNLLVNDTLIASPGRHVKSSVVRFQAGLTADQFLVRDLSSPNDVLIDNDEILDLAEGNVFVSRSVGECRRDGVKDSPAKLAWFLDDRFEITTRPSQTGLSIRELFGKSADIILLRDYESPIDRPVEATDAILFKDGPVFISREGTGHEKEITIIVNLREKKVRPGTITFEQVVELGFDVPPVGADLMFTVSYRRGPAENSEGNMVAGGTPVKLKERMVFNVTATDRS
jgi:hypothetical protein